MKRTYSNMDKPLKIKRPKFLKCDVCGKRVYNYELCTKPYTYCSIDCISLLILSNKNGFLHEESPNFEMKRVESHDNLMKLE